MCGTSLRSIICEGTFIGEYQIGGGTFNGEYQLSGGNLFREYQISRGNFIGGIK